MNYIFQKQADLWRNLGRRDFSFIYPFLFNILAKYVPETSLN